MEKLKHLLSHWIEHSEEHTKKYNEWAEKIKDSNPEVSKLMYKAVENFRKGEEYLKEALKRLD